MKNAITLIIMFFTLFFSAPLLAASKMNGEKNMKITSSAFQTNAFIPKQYTCDANDISPPLQWCDAPRNTKSFVLIVDDPDAPGGNWDHWILFNIPADATELKENMSVLPVGTKVGKNGWGRTDYGGPCPPSNVHRYIFTLYALDSILSLEAGAAKNQITQAMNGHVIAQAELIGKYQRGG